MISFEKPEGMTITDWLRQDPTGGSQNNQRNFAVARQFIPKGWKVEYVDNRTHYEDRLIIAVHCVKKYKPRGCVPYTLAASFHFTNPLCEEYVQFIDAFFSLGADVDDFDGDWDAWSEFVQQVINPDRVTRLQTPGQVRKLYTYDIPKKRAS
jgi:hypothetical protein